MTRTDDPQGDAAVLVVAAYPLVSELVARSLRCEGLPAVVVAGCDIRHDPAAALLAREPAVALFDIELGHELHCGHSRMLADAAQVLPTVVLAGVESDADAVAWLDAGVSRTVTKSCSLAELVDALTDAMAGDRDLAHTVASRRLARERARTLVARLTSSEVAVLDRLVDGLTVTQIAEERTVSAATVRTQVRAVLTKLEVTSQLAAVAVAAQAAG